MGGQGPPTSPSPRPLKLLGSRQRLGSSTASKQQQDLPPGDRLARRDTHSGARGDDAVNRGGGGVCWLLGQVMSLGPEGAGDEGTLERSSQVCLTLQELQGTQETPPPLATSGSSLCGHLPLSLGRFSGQSLGNHRTSNSSWAPGAGFPLRHLLRARSPFVPPFQASIITRQ